MAQQTRTAVNELKQLAALRQACMPFESARMQDFISELVQCVRAFMLSKRGGGGNEARAALASSLDRIRMLANELCSA